MKKWILKAAVQKTISYLPYGHKINYLFQKYVTKGVYLTDEYFTDRLIHAREHIESYEQLSDNASLNTTFELGTGWYPVIPISLFLNGANNIYSIDISPLLTKKTLHITIKKFIEAFNSNTLNRYIKINTGRIEKLKYLYDNYEQLTLSEIMSNLNFTYLLKDARQTGLPDSYFDLITSNNTLEHVYPKVLFELFAEFKRILKRNGIMSHSIDLSDHFSHFDKTISNFNFLQFSDKQWQWIDNSIQPQNRLRVTDFRNLYRELNIPVSIEKVTRGDIKSLSALKLDEKYKNIPIEDIAVTQCYFASKM
jgi:SAM-dependent methyltransferase